tara:strand:- start:6153 stop:6422 length:270 start_codon:yes stop_codon:yes gene_type:complete
MIAAQRAVNLDMFEIENTLVQIKCNQHANNPLQSFTNVLSQAGVNPADCAAIEGFIPSGHSDPRTALIDLFKATRVIYPITADRFIIAL